jgi:putative transposase
MTATPIPSSSSSLQPGEVDRPTDRWHSRGYLPHFESEGTVQHITYHLADSLPRSVTDDLQEELRALPADRRIAVCRQRIQDLLDAGHGCCIMREPEVAELVQDAFLHFDGQRYRLLAWVIMPNHVHVVFQPQEGRTVSRIVWSWESFTGRQIAE